MSRSISLKKCLDLKIAGALGDNPARRAVSPAVCAVTPDDFTGFQPKAEAKEGDSVMAGSPLMHDKRHEDVKVVSPVAGTVKAVVRGARRKIERIEIEVAQDPSLALGFDRSAIDTRHGALSLLCQAGMLARLRQRPFDIVPDPTITPRDIFVTAIDSAPLAADPAMMLGDVKSALEAGVKLLGLLTDGKVYLSVRPDWAMGEIAGAEMVEIKGCHPAGLPGVQIANIRPVNKGETVWTLDVYTLYKIGKLATTGKVDGATTVAVVGPEVVTPELVDTIEGAPICALVKDNIVADGCHHRIISGNVLTGVAVGEDGYLRAPYRQVTVIAEGDDVDEFMGWASLSPKKMSGSPTFPGRFLRKLFKPDARLLGGRRAMIMSGEYDRVMPMDILPEYLLKAIIGRDLERMEELGIYEVAPEDFALAEYVDTSKMELQRIVREGLDWLRKETE